MKYILIFLALFLNGCAVYIIKCDCPPRDTVIIQEYPPFENFKPIPLPYIRYYPDWGDSIQWEYHTEPYFKDDGENSIYISGNYWSREVK